ncbi:hypothetical protein MACJ_002154 [Theileria orientalis]|uniref:Uncharacterized protein n=1 Tax=Theileria orientalis TaxID=68886 RepID=A0A976QR59_THEOR|nr:hypothetical protein MACJ_002154 [Theileria orientalis]
MAKFRIFYRKLKRIKYLSDLVKRPPAVAELDKLWGFSPEDNFKKRTKKPKRHKENEVIKDPLQFFDKKPVESGVELADSVSFKHVDKQHEEGTDYKYVNEKEFFRESVKDLRKLVYPHLDPITKKHFDEIKLLALGGKVAHNRKMPYKEFQQRQKALKRHLDKNKKLEGELGVRFTLDTKGGSRFAELQKRKESREKRRSKPLFSDKDRDGIYRIKL